MTRRMDFLNGVYRPRSECLFMPGISGIMPGASGDSGSELTFVGGFSFQIAASTSVFRTVDLTSLTGGIGTAPQEGDLVIVAYSSAADADINMQCTTAGFTEHHDLRHRVTAGDANLGVYSKIMTSSPDTFITVGPTGSSSNPGRVLIHVWRGVDQVTPQDVAAITGIKNGSANPNPTGITPITLGAVIIVFATSSHTTANAWTGHPELQNLVQGGADPGCAVGSFPWSGSGAYDPAAFTGGSNLSSGACVWAVWALRPA